MEQETGLAQGRVWPQYFWRVQSLKFSAVQPLSQPLNVLRHSLYVLLSYQAASGLLICLQNCTLYRSTSQGILKGPVFPWLRTSTVCTKPTRNRIFIQYAVMHNTFQLPRYVCMTAYCKNTPTDLSTARTCRLKTIRNKEGRAVTTAACI